MLNLIGNATKFCKEGSVNVVISWHSSKSKIEYLRKPKQDFQSESRLKSMILTSPSQKATNEISFEFENTEKRTTNMQDILGRRFRTKPFRELNSPKAAAALKHSTSEDSLPTFVESSGWIKIEVVDSGCGIFQNALGNLFQPKLIPPLSGVMEEQVWAFISPSKSSTKWEARLMLIARKDKDPPLWFLFLLKLQKKKIPYS